MLEKVTDTMFGIAQTDLFTQKLATSSNMSVVTAKGNEAIERYRAQLEKKSSAMDLLISKIQQQYSSFLS